MINKKRRMPKIRYNRVGTKTKQNTMENLQQRLKQGERLMLSNELHQASIGDDDIRFAHLEFTDDCPIFPNEFKITFNGMLIHSSKTFKSFEKRLNTLIDKWTLGNIENED